MNDENSDNTSDWKACVPGTLTSLSTRLRRNRRRETIVKATMLVAAVLLTVSAGRMFLQNSGNNPGQPMMYAGITCDDVVAKLTQWKKGQLDEATATRIDEHLKLCSSCAAKARTLQAQRDKKGDKKGSGPILFGTAYDVVAVESGKKICVRYCAPSLKLPSFTYGRSWQQKINAHRKAETGREGHHRAEVLRSDCAATTAAAR